MTNQNKLSAGYIGWATHGLFAIGTLAAIIGVVRVYAADDGTGAGVCWIASALAFGQLLNALVRR